MRCLIDVFLAVEANCKPMIYVVHNKFFFPLFRIYQLAQTDNDSDAMESIEKFIFYLPPAVDGLYLQVGVPIKCEPIQRMHKLLHQ